MGLLSLLFLATLVLSLLVFAIGVLSRGWRDVRTQVGLVLLLCSFVSFAIGYGMVCYDPYWIDNDVKEFIHWGDRWSWAMEFGGLLQLIVIPFGLVAYGYWHRKNNPRHI